MRRVKIAVEVMGEEPTTAAIQVIVDEDDPRVAAFIGVLNAPDEFRRELELTWDELKEPMMKQLGSAASDMIKAFGRAIE